MNTIMVWVLVVSSWNSYGNMVEELGPYATRNDCVRVQQSAPIRKFESECVQVKSPVMEGGFGGN